MKSGKIGFKHELQTHIRENKDQRRTPGTGKLYSLACLFIFHEEINNG